MFIGNSMAISLHGVLGRVPLGRGNGWEEAAQGPERRQQRPACPCQAIMLGSPRGFSRGPVCAENVWGQAGSEVCSGLSTDDADARAAQGSQG